MDYSELIEAIDQDDRSKVNELISSLTPRLKRFLEIHMNANREDAEDVVQKTLIKVIQAIKKGKVEEKKSILAFTFKTCRNTYLNYMDQNKRESYEGNVENQTQKPGQLMAILDEERQEILKSCIDQLSSSYKQFINFWFTHPDTNAKTVAKHFDISVSNVWTRKHRVIKKLNECYKKKSEI